MRLPQTAHVPVPTPVVGLNTSSRNKITKGGLRQAQARYGSAANTPNTKPSRECAQHRPSLASNTTGAGPAENPEKWLRPPGELRETEEKNRLRRDGLERGG